MFNNSSFRGARVAQWVMSLHLTTHTSLSPIRRGFAPGFVNYKKGCTRLATSCHKVYQLLAHGRLFSSGTPASSSGSKTGRHDIAEILLKVALKHKTSINQSSFSLENYANSRGVEHDVPKQLSCITNWWEVLIWRTSCWQLMTQMWSLSNCGRNF